MFLTEVAASRGLIQFECLTLYGRSIEMERKEGRKEGVAGAINGNAPTQHAGVVRAIDRWCNIWRKALLLGVSARSRSDDQEESNAELYSKISLISFFGPRFSSTLDHVFAHLNPVRNTPWCEGEGWRVRVAHGGRDC